MRSPNISRGVAKNTTKFQGRELWRIVNRLKLLSIVAKLSISDISVGPSPDSDLLKGMIWSLVCFHLVLLLYEELKLNGKIPDLKNQLLRLELPNILICGKKKRVFMILFTSTYFES